MCLARFEMMLDFVMSMALLLSDSKRNGRGKGKLRIDENIRSQRSSFVVCVMAMYSASMEERAIAFCFELDQDTRLECRKNAYPEMLLWSSWCVAQSASERPTQSVRTPSPYERQWC